MTCRCVCGRLHEFTHTCAHIHACILSVCRSNCAIPRSTSSPNTHLTPSVPACQWYGPLIGGPGLGHHGNCTKANKGVEQSRGNTVTQRGLPSTVEDFRRGSHKGRAAAKEQSGRRSLCLSLRTPQSRPAAPKSAVCRCAGDFKLIPCLSLVPALELRY